MCHSKCGGGGCSVSMVVKVLVIIGGVNWGLVGLGMFLDSDFNVVHRVLVSLPVLEAVVYLLVGVAAVVKIFGCRCKKCMTTCANCGTDGKMEGSM